MTPVTGGIVAVHAHPDDESITMGATLARYAASHVPVTLVTATLGEHGEVMHGRFTGLDAAHADQLGGYRLAELRRAARTLGVSDHRMLGGLGTFRDSGMAGEPSSLDPRAFIHAQRGGRRHDEAVAALLEVLAQRRPAVVLTYDETGGYGHPDHIAAHDVTVAAVARMSTAHGSRLALRPRLCEVIRPRSEVADALNRMWHRPLPEGYLRPRIDELGTLVDAVREDDIAIATGPFAAVRRIAMSAHATQLEVWAGSVDGFALTNLKAQPLLPVEYFRVLSGPSAPPGTRDLFADLDHLAPAASGPGNPAVR